MILWRFSSWSIKLYSVFNGDKYRKICFEWFGLFLDDKTTACKLSTYRLADGSRIHGSALVFEVKILFPWYRGQYFF